MAVQKHKVTRATRGQRRSHHRIAKPTLSQDPLTGTTHLRHHISPDGYYKGELVIETQVEDEDDED